MGPVATHLAGLLIWEKHGCWTAMRSIAERSPPPFARNTIPAARGAWELSTSGAGPTLNWPQRVTCSAGRGWRAAPPLSARTSRLLSQPGCFSIVFPTETRPALWALGGGQGRSEGTEMEGGDTLAAFRETPMLEFNSFFIFSCSNIVFFIKKATPCNNQKIWQQ